LAARILAIVQSPDPPDLPPRLEPLTLSQDDAADGESWQQIALADVALPGLDARALGFMEARFERVDLSGARLANLFLSDCELAGCNLANLVARNGSMRRVRIDAGRLTGMTWTGGSVRDAMFLECRADIASFAESRLERVSFEDCDLRDADFRQARLESVGFSGCDLTGADISGARLERCAMRSCTIEGLRGVDRLSGVAMPWADVVAAAGVFAGALGVRLLDDE
jgi:uncharacterized protein YjbI with pentapeptide repeats